MTGVNHNCCELIWSFLNVDVIHVIFLLLVVNCSSDSAGPNLQTMPIGHTSHGTNVSFSCALGYTLNGSSFLTCEPTGQWSGALPSCDQSKQTWWRGMACVMECVCEGGMCVWITVWNVSACLICASLASSSPPPLLKSHTECNCSVPLYTKKTFRYLKYIHYFKIF